MTRTIGFLLYPGFQLLDMAGPQCAFEWASRIRGEQLYQLEMISVRGGRVMSSSGLTCKTLPMEQFCPETLIAVGGAPWRLTRKEVQRVRTVALRAKRAASVCTGAFVLAQCGLLDGLRVTTHWHHAAELQRDFPALRVESNSIYINEGRIWTSAGITAGIDLSLALIQEDHGAELSREVARELVVYYRRPGGQSQFSEMSEIAPESDRIRNSLSYAREHLTQDLTVKQLAAVAHLSDRQFGRVFRSQTGESPARAVERLRAELARERVEHSAEPVEVIAAAVGFSDPERMRRAFLRLYGEPPQALRRKARSLK